MKTYTGIRWWRAIRIISRKPPGIPWCAMCIHHIWMYTYIQSRQHTLIKVDVPCGLRENSIRIVEIIALPIVSLTLWESQTICTLQNKLGMAVELSSVVLCYEKCSRRIKVMITCPQINSQLEGTYVLKFCSLTHHGLKWEQFFALSKNIWVMDMFSCVAHILLFQQGLQSLIH